MLGKLPLNSLALSICFLFGLPIVQGAEPITIAMTDSEEARKAPDGRCSLENGSFTLLLEAGDNEVAVAIANNFFGWGLMLRLTDPEGVHLAAK